MKKYLSVILGSLLLLSLFGCKQNAEKNDNLVEGYIFSDFGTNFGYLFELKGDLKSSCFTKSDPRFYHEEELNEDKRLNVLEVIKNAKYEKVLDNPVYTGTENGKTLYNFEASKLCPDKQDFTCTYYKCYSWDAAKESDPGNEQYVPEGSFIFFEKDGKKIVAPHEEEAYEGKKTIMELIPEKGTLKYNRGSTKAPDWIDWKYWAKVEYNGDSYYVVDSFIE